MVTISFLEYLKEIHADQYFDTDDKMPDDFEDWLEDLSVDQVIEYAEKWGQPIL